jgi:TPR repeat protein
MRTIRDHSLISVATAAALALMGSIVPAHAQTAADAALDLANMLDGAGGGVSGEDLVAALEDAAEAGQPMALWQLGTMYETGEGVERDPAKAFSYFSQIANPHLETPPKGLDADIIAESFVKVSQYHRDGLPEAGIPENQREAEKMLYFASTYFGDPEAQYRLGKLYAEQQARGANPLHSARWFSSAAHKGHCGAQAELGNMLFYGVADIEPQPVEGLMWLVIAQQRCALTENAGWVDQLTQRALDSAVPEQRAEALALAERIAPEFTGL